MAKGLGKILVFSAVGCGVLSAATFSILAFKARTTLGDKRFQAKAQPPAVVDERPAQALNLANPPALAVVPIRSHTGIDTVSIDPAGLPSSKVVSVPAPAELIGPANLSGEIQLAMPRSVAPTELGTVADIRPAGAPIRIASLPAPQSPTRIDVAPERPPTVALPLQHANLAPTSKPSAGIPLSSVDSIQASLPPPLEVERDRQDSPASPVDAGVKIVTGFDCSTPLNIQRISNTHFAVTLTTDSTLRNWFMFQLVGVKDKTVRIDILNAPLGKWYSLNPVFSDVPSLDDLHAFDSKTCSAPSLVAAYNGSMLPDTTGQRWHYISNVWGEKSVGGKMADTFCFVQHYDSDTVFIAMRAPYTPAYNEAYLASLRQNPLVRVVEIGKSVGGRPLTLVQIGADAKTHPGLLIYAREHPDEHDSSWVCQGAMDFLLSNDPIAVDLRGRFNFTFIPLFDPDGAVASKYDTYCDFFADVFQVPETIAYADWFQSWLHDGNRIDLALTLHNVESGEYPHVGTPVWSTRNGRRAQCEALCTATTAALAKKGFVEQSGYRMGGVYNSRLSGWVGENFGALSMLYETNSQAKDRHLTLNELRDLGSCLLWGGIDYLDSPAGSGLLTRNQKTRQSEIAIWNTHKSEWSTFDAIHSEALLFKIAIATH